MLLPCERLSALAQTKTKNKNTPMAKKYSASSLGAALTFDVPSTVDEFTEYFGAGPLDAANTQMVNHGYLSAFRSKFVDALEAAFGKRAVVSNKTVNGKSVDVLQKDADFVASLRAEHGNGPVDEVATQVITSYPFLTWAKDSDAGTGGRIGAKYIEEAETVMAAWTSGKSNPEKFLDRISSLVPNADIPADATVEDVARLIKIFRTRQVQNDLT